MSKKLSKLTDQITAEITSLKDEIETVTKTAASAGRARKLTNSLGKLFKEFRKESIAYHKN